MHVIIGGCGRVGAQLAERLSAEGHDVVIVDSSERAFVRLGAAFNGDTVIGDVTDTQILGRAGIDRADALVAVTSQDNVNLMVVQIAQALYSVPRTVARLFSPEREESYRKMGVHYVSGTRLVAKAMLNELRDAFPQHVSFPDDTVEVVEMAVAERGHGVSIAEMERKGDVRVAAIRRGRRTRLPKPNDTVLLGDVVVAAVQRGAYRDLREYMCNPADAEPAGVLQGR